MKSKFCVILSFISSFAIAQNNWGRYDQIKPGDIYIQGSLPYSSIKFIDARFDSTKLGYFKRGKEFKKIITGERLSKIVQDHINLQLKNQLATGAEKELFIVIKKLWLQEINMDELENKKISITSGNSGGGYSVVTSVFDIYLKTDSTYIPLLKIDTSLYSLKNLQKDAGYLLSYTIENCLVKIKSLNLTQIKNPKSIYRTEIDQYNNKRLAYPRFQNDTIVRGIYLTFKDFLNNKPTVRKFIAESGKLTDELYIEENGTPVVLQNFWGFCDGEKNYYKLGYNFFELKREENTYEIFGSKTIVDKNRKVDVVGGSGSLARDALNTGIWNGLFNSNKKQGNYRLLQLDMETGRVY